MQISRIIFAIVGLAAAVLYMGSTLAIAGDLSAPKDITFTAQVDGTPQKYVLMLPEGFDPAKECHLLLAFHGHGSDRSQFATNPRGECQGARDVAAKYNLVYVCPDYRAKTSWMGPKAEADTVQIIRELRKKYKVGKAILVGGSMGGTAVLTFTALHSDMVAGVCSLNGTADLVEYDKFQDAISESFGGKKADIPAEYKRRSAKFSPEKFTMPVAITAGGKDTTVPAKSVVELARTLSLAKRPVLLLFRENGGHATNYADTVAALEFVVRSALGIAEKSAPPAPGK